MVTEGAALGGHGLCQTGRRSGGGRTTAEEERRIRQDRVNPKEKNKTKSKLTLSEGGSERAEREAEWLESRRSVCAASLRHTPACCVMTLTHGALKKELRAGSGGIKLESAGSTASSVSIVSEKSLNTLPVKFGRTL